MMVAFTQDKLSKLKALLTNWHKSRRTFTLQQIAKLLGILQHVGQVCSWIKYLLSAIYNSVRQTLRANRKKFLASPEYNIYRAHLEPAPGITVPDKHKSFALSKIMHGIWETSNKFFITKTKKAELAILHNLAMGTHVLTWGSPIAHLVDRPADAQVLGTPVCSQEARFLSISPFGGISPGQKRYNVAH